MSINYDGMFEKLKSKDKKALDASITIRLDRAAKKEFEEICEKMGMTVSSAINAWRSVIPGVPTVEAGKPPTTVTLSPLKYMQFL